MPFAIAMTLVVLVSSLVLLYQFTSGELAHDADDAASDAPAPFPVERPGFSGAERPAFSLAERPTFSGRRVDSAA